MVPAAPTQTNGADKNLADSLLCTYFVSVVAANIAELLTYPLDLTKTRLQIQGEKAAAQHGVSNVSMSCDSRSGPYRGMFKTALGIAKEEGVLKLWQGITPAIYRHVIYSGTRIVTYEQLRNYAHRLDPEASVGISAMCGVTAGSVAQFLANPTDLIKVQIQMEGKRRLLGKPPRVMNFNHALKKIYAEGGVKGLWKGSIPNVQRAALVNLGDLTTYDTAKRFILTHTTLPDSPLTHVLSSSCAGLVAAIMGTPADVVKTRIMNQPTDSNGKGLVYKSSIDCLIKTVRNEGFLGLYKGFLPVWIRMAPWSLTFWLSFEQIRHVIGASGF